jgi:hypothetical protein
MLTDFLSYLARAIKTISPYALLAALWASGVYAGWQAHRANVYGRMLAAELADFRRHRRAKRTDRLREPQEGGGAC